MTRPTKNFGPTAQRILNFILEHPCCSHDDIYKGVYGGVRSPTTIKSHLHRIAQHPGVKLKRKSVYWIEQSGRTR